MQKILIILSAFIMFVSACKKKEFCPENTKKAPQSEVDNLEAYIISNSINAVKHGNGFYYTITDSVFGSKPTTCSNIRVKYKGTLTNGSIFDQSNSAVFTLSNLIPGWQQGLPLIGIGGTIILYLPPSLGYGSVTSGSIPANSILIFEIELLGF